MPLQISDINLAMQQATATALGIDIASNLIRLSWPTGGQPGFSVKDNVSFIRCIEEENPYNKIREVTKSYNDGAGFGNTPFATAPFGDDPVNGESFNGPPTLTVTTTYTRVWRVYWCFYGPQSFDNARALRSSLFKQSTRFALNSQNLYVTPDFAAPMRAPEVYAGQWWERTDFSACFYEAVSETDTIGTVHSVEVIVEDSTHIIEDVTITPGIGEGGHGEGGFGG